MAAEDDSVIRLKDVSRTFRDFWLRPTVKAVDGLSLTVRRGEVFGLLGPNGSGKSTTIKMILGLLSPSGGEVTLFGLPPRTVAARRRLGYLPELSYLHPFLTAKETLMYYAGLCGLRRAVAAERARELLRMVGLTEVAGRPVGGFSKGMARRIALASALIGRPDLLVLDEPTSGLDPVSTKEVKTMIKALSDHSAEHPEDQQAAAAAMQTVHAHKPSQYNEKDRIRSDFDQILQDMKKDSLQKAKDAVLMTKNAMENMTGCIKAVSNGFDLHNLTPGLLIDFIMGQLNMAGIPENVKPEMDRIIARLREDLTDYFNLLKTAKEQIG